MTVKKTKFLLFLVDYALLVLALYVVLVIRYRPEVLAFEFSRHMRAFGWIFLLWLLTFYIADLYNYVERVDYRAFISAIAINIAIAIAAFYLLPQLDIAPRRNLALVAGFFSLFFMIWRSLFNRLMEQSGVAQSVIFVGSDEFSLQLAKRIADRPRLGYKVAAIVQTRDTLIPRWVVDHGIPVYREVGELREPLEQRLREARVVISDHWLREGRGELYGMIRAGLRFYQLSSFWEELEEAIPIFATNEAWFLQNMNRGINRVHLASKRAMDIVLTVPAAAVALPIMLLFGALVRMTSKGPIIYRQVRVGRNNRNFVLYKFRSMRQDAELNGAQWASENDPRVTAVGKFMRQTRIDELPQIVNILRGDMSLVGPRPERPEFVEQLSQAIPHYHLRHMVPPGLTGWAQVRYQYGASEEDAAVKLMYDLYYVKNLSLLFDIRILLKTILTVVNKMGR